jgi:hypothetical protein
MKDRKMASKVDFETLDVAWLLWLDAIDRLDTIILEVRHSQINLIHALRASDLYAPLRYEEDYLWGSYKDGAGHTHSWRDLLGQAVTVREMERWVGGWVIPYPAFLDAIAGSQAVAAPEDANRYCQSKLRQRTVQELSENINRNVQNGYWTTDSRRLYHALCSLQHLKSNILRDKLVLCRWGINAIATGQSRESEGRNQTGMALGRFLLTRSAIMAAAHRHIQSLGDLKAQFESALDLGIQDHPKPMTRRRREQGLYSSYLSDRYRDLAEVMEDFLIYSDSSANKATSNDSKTFRGSLYAHRWSHSAASSISIMRDEIDRDYWNERQRHTDLVNTSFWMPDRPDLQSIIAHEVAHASVHHAFGSLEPYALRHEDGHFPALVRLLATALDAFGMTRFTSGDPRYAHDHALTELTCDLLAATVTGPAFLFALVQEIIGQDLDCLFHSPQHDIDFDLAESWLADGWAAVNLPGFEWYYRLRVTCAWTRGIVDSGDVLANRLIDGVEELCTILLDTTVRLGPKGAEAHFHRWHLLAQTMVDVIKDSQALKMAKAWKSNTRDRKSLAGNTFCPGGDQSAVDRPLNPKTTEILQDIVIRQKMAKSRLLENDVNAGGVNTGADIIRKFVDVYMDGAAHRSRTDINLFRYVHDIPWQAALLRARDFLCDHGGRHGRIASTSTDGKWLIEMHTDGAPGRELYQVALEFAYWQQKSPCDAISAILRLWSGANDGSSSNCIQAIKTKSPVQYKVLRQWMQEQSPEHEKTTARLLDYFLRYSSQYESGRLALFDTLVQETTPRDLIDAPFIFKKFPPGTSQGARRSFFTRLQISKLKELRDIAECHKNQSPFSEILDYLRSTTYECDALNSEDIEATILNAFLVSTVRTPVIMMLERTAASQLRAYANQQEHGSCYRDPVDGDDRVSSYHSLLGRYDLFGLGSGDVTFRPRLPKFVRPPPSGPSAADEPLPPPFFVRHELAIAYRLFDNRPIRLNDRDYVPLAFISVTLNSRSDRLNFLYRLRNKYKAATEDEAGFDCNDLVLLSEGWGDVIIVIQIPQSKDNSSQEYFGRRKVKAIFDIQEKLFSDFLVERTELILTFRSLKFVCAKDVNLPERDDFWPFSVISRFRLSKSILEGDILRSPNNSFRKGLEELGKACKERMAFDIVRTPGRTDYTVYFRCRHMLANQEFRSGFFQRVGESDDVLTVVGYRESATEGGAPPRSFKCADPIHCKFRTPSS